MTALLFSQENSISQEPFLLCPSSKRTGLTSSLSLNLCSNAVFSITHLKSQPAPLHVPPSLLILLRLTYFSSFHSIYHFSTDYVVSTFIIYCLSSPTRLEALLETAETFWFLIHWWMECLVPGTGPVEISVEWMIFSQFSLFCFSLLLTDKTSKWKGLGFFLSRGLWSMLFIFKVSEWFDLIILLLALYIRRIRRIK